MTRTIGAFTLVTLGTDTDNGSTAKEETHVRVTGTDLSTAWTLTGGIKFDWETTTSNGEKPRSTV